MSRLDARISGKIIFSTVAMALFALRTLYPEKVPSDALSLGLVLVAVLPWVDSLIQRAELPGGWVIEFRDLKEKVERNQALINDIVRYSMSASIFNHLCGIALLRTYNYVDNEGNRREFYFLRDNGLIRPKSGGEFLEFDPAHNGRNLVDIAEATPIGWECVNLRLADVPPNMRNDANNLRVPLLGLQAM
jgi:hypothetical protein